MLPEQCPDNSGFAVRIRRNAQLSYILVLFGINGDNNEKVNLA